MQENVCIFEPSRLDWREGLGGWLKNLVFFPPSPQGGGGARGESGKMGGINQVSRQFLMSERIRSRGSYYFVLFREVY